MFPDTQKEKQKINFFFYRNHYTTLLLVSNPKAKQDCQMVYENNIQRPVEYLQYEYKNIREVKIKKNEQTCFACVYTKWTKYYMWAERIQFKGHVREYTVNRRVCSLYTLFW